MKQEIMITEIKKTINASVMGLPLSALLLISLSGAMLLFKSTPLCFSSLLHSMFVFSLHLAILQYVLLGLSLISCMRPNHLKQHS